MNNKLVLEKLRTRFKEKIELRQPIPMRDLSTALGRSLSMTRRDIKNAMKNLKSDGKAGPKKRGWILEI